jgi:hypothetical protein
MTLCVIPAVRRCMHHLLTIVLLLSATALVMSGVHRLVKEHTSCRAGMFTICLHLLLAMDLIAVHCVQARSHRSSAANTETSVSPPVT